MRPSPRGSLRTRVAWIVSCLLALALALVVRQRRLPGPLGVIAAAAIPFLTPASPQWFRLVVSFFAVVWAARIWERSRGREPDLRSAPWRFWLWWFVPADARAAKDAAQAATHQRQGWARLARVIPKAVLVVSLVLINRAITDVTAHGLAFTVWSMLYLYALISAIADGLTGLLMLTGLHMSESFESPMLARSSSEFWGRRWNRFITRWAFSNVFVPAGGRRRPAAATLLVFVISGLMHEYLVVACGHGFGNYTGWMLAFFVVHGLGVMLVSRVPWELPRLVAVVLHTAFVMVTAPLFFLPLDDAVGYSRWWKVFLA